MIVRRELEDDEGISRGSCVIEVVGMLVGRDVSMTVGDKVGAMDGCRSVSTTRSPSKIAKVDMSRSANKTSNDVVMMHPASRKQGGAKMKGIWERLLLLFRPTCCCPSSSAASTCCDWDNDMSAASRSWV